MRMILRDPQVWKVFTKLSNANLGFELLLGFKGPVRMETLSIFEGLGFRV